MDSQKIILIHVMEHLFLIIIFIIFNIVIIYFYFSFEKYIIDERKNFFPPCTYIVFCQVNLNKIPMGARATNYRKSKKSVSDFFQKNIRLCSNLLFTISTFSRILYNIWSIDFFFSWKYFVTDYHYYYYCYIFEN